MANAAKNLINSVPQAAATTFACLYPSSLMYSCTLSAGTGVYAPPELLISGIYNRTGSTAWSLGILLFNMLGIYTQTGGLGQ